MNTLPKTDARPARREPLTLLIAALGGQGGGVLADWISHAARAGGLVVQATSIPGVSQRTGATTYYLELASLAERDSPPPVLALTPLPGRIDVLVCSELLEAARMLERGMITPTRTTVVASTHRMYTTREKMNAADGRFDTGRILDALRALARRTLLFDMEAVRAQHGAAISAVLFGALAGSGAAPLSRAACEGAIRAAGKGVATSLAAFGDAFERATRTAAEECGNARAAAGSGTGDAPLPAVLAQRIASLPGRVAEFARLGAMRTIAYQDIGYAERYLDRVERVTRAEAGAPAAGSDYEVAREAARYLALWMCYEDLIRVASLKGRASRVARIRREVAARDGDVVRVYDMFKPGMHEIAAVLPHALGAWLERRTRAHGLRPHRGKGITLHASSFSGALALRLCAALRPLRPYSLRFGQEQEAIDDWLVAVEKALAARTNAGPRAALEVVRLPRLLKGYGETHAGGRETFRRMLEAYRKGGDSGLAAAEALRVASAAALDHSEDRQFAGQPLVKGTKPRPQPVVWAGRRRDL